MFKFILNNQNNRVKPSKIFRMGEGGKGGCHSNFLKGEHPRNFPRGGGVFYFTPFQWTLASNSDSLLRKPLFLDVADTLSNRITHNQGTNAREVNCGCVFSAYISKPDLSGRTL